MRTQKTPVAFISAHLTTEESTSNKIRHERLKNELRDQGLIVMSDVFGQYKGDTEMSVMVMIRNDYEFEKVQDISRFFKQESVLFCDNEGTGEIVHNDGRLDRLGEYSIGSHTPVGIDFSYIRANETFLTFNKR